MEIIDDEEIQEIEVVDEFANKLDPVKKEIAEEIYQDAKKDFEDAERKLRVEKENLQKVEDEMARYFVRSASAITQGENEI